MSITTRSTEAGTLHSRAAICQGNSLDACASVSPPTSTDRFGYSVLAEARSVGSTVFMA